MTRFLAAAFLLAPLLSPGAARAQAADPRAARVDALFAGYNRAPQPGLAVAVVRDGRVILRRGYGLADVERRVPITPSTVFDIASLSKQFTGLAVAMLATEGRLRTGDDVRRYLPEMPRRTPPITLDHLLHHTSGLRDWPGTLLIGGAREGGPISLDDILAMAYRQRSLNFTPGAEHLYSNTGYNLLAEVVQRVTGRPFRAWSDERIFRPLGMTRTHVRDDPAEVIAGRALGYEALPGGRFHATPNNLAAVGSSSVFSTVDDLARWLINLDRPTVGAGAMRLMLTRGRLNDGTVVPYAFGLEHGTYRGQPMVTHSGSWASFSTYIVQMPRQRLGIVVLANSGSIDAQNAVIRIADIYLENDLPPVAPPPRVPAPPRVAVPAAVLDAYAGLYRLGPGWYARIRHAGDSLTSQATNERVVAMTARSAREFWVEDYGAAMVFQRDGSGRVTHLDYRGIHAPRLDESARPPPLADYAGVFESAELGTSYRVAVVNGALEMRHARQGTIPLTRLWGDDFGSPVGYLASVEFQRDRAGRVTGLIVNGDSRSRNIRFTKRP